MRHMLIFSLVSAVLLSGCANVSLNAQQRSDDSSHYRWRQAWSPDVRSLIDSPCGLTEIAYDL